MTERPCGGRLRFTGLPGVSQPGHADTAKAMRRFLQEAKVVGRLHHANIAQFFDAENYQGTGLLAMEFIEGQSLAQLVAQRGPLPAGIACQIAIEIARGLAYAHASQVIHRDIKPHNVMIEAATGRVKIVDFGLGRLVDERRSHAALTDHDDILGTPKYMAPEQNKNSHTVDHRADIYGLGCTFYFMLIGEPPFRGDSFLELWRQHDVAPIPSVAAWRDDVPATVCELISKLLAKSPEDRPQSATDVVDALAPFVLRSGAPRTSASPLSGSARRSELIIGVARAAVASPLFWLPLATIVFSLIAAFTR